MHFYTHRALLLVLSKFEVTTPLAHRSPLLVLKTCAKLSLCSLRVFSLKSHLLFYFHCTRTQVCMHTSHKSLKFIAYSISVPLGLPMLSHNIDNSRTQTCAHDHILFVPNNVGHQPKLATYPFLCPC